MTKKKQAPTVARPFETDYAGAWRGRCLTRENALKAAVAHIVEDGYSRCTVRDTRTGELVARVRLNDARTSAVIETIKPFLKGRGPRT